MSDSLATQVSALRNRRVLVVGDAMLDEYLTGESSRISPEAPVPVLKVHGSKCVLGGAANTAANVASLGGQAILVALVGSDDSGKTLKSCATEAGIRLLAVDHGHATVRKTRVVGQQQQIVRLDYEEPVSISGAIQAEILRLVEREVEHCDIVVVSDYAKGLLSESLVQSVIRHAHDAKREVIVDPKPQHRDYYRQADYLTPNWKESRALLRLPDAEPSEESAKVVARDLALELKTNVVLTLGARGICFCSRNGTEQFAQPTLAREVFDVSGAGDTVVAAFALARASGADHPAAVAIANRAASVVVGKFGTATVTPEELLDDGGAVRLVPRAALAALAAQLKARGKRVVTVNGSFDLLHAGHLYILNEARKLGDVLIVGLNSDRSVRGYKGPGRPIVPEAQRAEMLLALRVVDYVHLFDEADPRAFLEEIRPHVHVNGSEYGENCIEADTVKKGGGIVHIVSRIPSLSTSGLVEALKAADR